MRPIILSKFYTPTNNTIQVPYKSAFNGDSRARRKVLHRATTLVTHHFGLFTPQMYKFAGSQNHSLSGRRIFGGVHGRRARLLTARPTVEAYRYQMYYRGWWKVQSWRKSLYAGIARPESQALAAKYSLLDRQPSVVRANRYTFAVKNRKLIGPRSNPFRFLTGPGVRGELGTVKLFTQPYSLRVHYELAQMKFNARRKARCAPTLTPTMRRYLERMWRVRFRLRFEKFFFKRTGCRTYVWLQSTFRGLRTSYRRRFRFVARFGASKRTRSLAAKWRWSTFQMAIFQHGLTMMMTLPGNLELPFITLRRLMRKHRGHFAVIRFFMTYIHKAISLRRLDSLYNFRMRVAGKFVGELKRRVCIVGNGEMRLARYQIPADFYTTEIVTKYGIFGLKFWVQIFPGQAWFDNILEPVIDVKYEDRILSEDLTYPGYIAFEPEQLVAQWFFREALAETRDVPLDYEYPVIAMRTLRDLGTTNRSDNFKLLGAPVPAKVD